MEPRIRKLHRLQGYDYSQNGAYFITICVKDKHEILWENGVGATFGRPQEPIQLSKYGLVVENEINLISCIYENNVIIDKYVIMPNHIHMIIILQFEKNGRPQVAPTIPRIIQQFKGSITKKIRFSIWQKLYHDHIIRNESDYQKIWKYIDENPLKWLDDCYYENSIS